VYNWVEVYWVVTEFYIITMGALLCQKKCRIVNTKVDFPLSLGMKDVLGGGISIFVKGVCHFYEEKLVNNSQKIFKITTKVDFGPY